MSVTFDIFIDKNKKRFVDELTELLRFPSISSEKKDNSSMIKCANWLVSHMESIGLKNCRLHSTNGNPAVYGEWLESPGAPTILIYGHYDVQPVDPLELWDSPPFEPVVKGEHIYARGSADDKGQFFAHLKAIEMVLNIEKKLPINIKVILEGEEEIGSPSLEGFLSDNAEFLSNDLIVVSDSPMYDYGIPSICYGLRGLAYLEIKITGPAKDLHSGSFGGVVANPIEVLTKIVAQLKDERGRILIPGFYDKVLKLTEFERENFRRLPFDERKYMEEVGSPELTGEDGFTTLERLWARPTLDPNGIMGGFTGSGAKTVIPSTAFCKVSMRLVPNQDPDETAALFEDYVKSICPSTVKIEIIRHHGGEPYLLPPESASIKIAARAMERGFGRQPVFVREGGSIPIMATFKDILKSDTILLPLGLPDENSHSPNEKFYLPNLFNGIKTAAYLMEEIAAQGI